MRGQLLRVLLLATIIVALLIVVVLFVETNNGTNSAIAIEWQHYLPGVIGSSVIQTSDGGYLALGLNISTYPINDFNETFFQTVAAKLDSSGNLVWIKSYSLQNHYDTSLTHAIQVSDGYVLAGSLGEQALLVKIDPNGNILWQQNYVSSYGNPAIAAGNPEGVYALIQTSDGGFALAAPSYTEAPNTPQYWIMKLDSLGNLLWKKGVSNSSFPFSGDPSSLFQTSDQGYIIVKTDAHHGPNPTTFSIIKFDSEGNLQWTKTFGGEGDYYNSYVSRSAGSSLALSDGYLIVGGASSSGGSETGLVLKTDLQGNQLWNRTYTYNGLPSIINTISVSDGGFMFVGPASVTTNSGTFERSFTWIAKIDNSGQIQGKLSIPMGKHQTNPLSIIQTSDGGHLFVGVWNDTNFNSLDQRFWIVKISPAT